MVDRASLIVHVTITKCSSCTSDTCGLEGNGDMEMVLLKDGKIVASHNDALCRGHMKLVVSDAKINIPNTADVLGGLYVNMGMLEDGLDDQLQTLHCWTEQLNYLPASCMDLNLFSGRKWSYVQAPLDDGRHILMICQAVLLQLVAPYFALSKGTKLLQKRPLCIVDAKACGVRL